jgi:hypothetical protein
MSGKPVKTSFHIHALLLLAGPITPENVGDIRVKIIH